MPFDFTVSDPEKDAKRVIEIFDNEIKNQKKKLREDARSLYRFNRNKNNLVYS